MTDSHTLGSVDRSVTSNSPNTASPFSPHYPTEQCILKPYSPHSSNSPPSSSPHRPSTIYSLSKCSPVSKTSSPQHPPPPPNKHNPRKPKTKNAPANGTNNACGPENASSGEATTARKPRAGTFISGLISMLVLRLVEGVVLRKFQLALQEFGYLGTFEAG